MKKKKKYYLGLGGEHLFWKNSKQIFHHGDGASGELNIFVIFKCHSWQSCVLIPHFICCLPVASYLAWIHIIDFELIWWRGVLWCYKQQTSFCDQSQENNQESYRLSLEDTAIFSTYTTFNIAFSKVHSITLNFFPFSQERCNIRRS